MLTVESLTKAYGARIALEGLSFCAEKGGVYGFLGPNGAGKSTTMNMIAGCLAITAGRVLIDGVDLLEEPERAKRKIGYLPEQPPLYPEMTPEEYLRFVARAKGVSRLQAAVEEAMERTSIGHMRHRLIRNLSKGYKQRVGLAQAILAEPEVVILDEPTVGLDPQQLVEVRSLIRELSAQAAVLFSSHILSEVSAVSDRVMILSNGRLVASDTTENLSRRLLGTNALKLTVRAEAERVLAALQPLAEEVRTAPSQEEGCLDVRIAASGDADIREAVAFRLSEAGIPLRSMAADRASLEQVFMELTSGAARTEAALRQEGGKADGGHL